jgi:cytochrome c oxidase assembly protein subunit 15
VRHDASEAAPAAGTLVIVDGEVGVWRVDRAQRVFRRLAIFTTALTYFLIAVGATVRVTGAGMGCPDWPTCFGLLVPPMSVEELPPPGSYDFPPGWSVERFDPLMTWIEYVNRLIGALVGLSILSTLIAAIVAFRRRAGVLVPTVVAFIGVLYAAWLGARVVAHELAPWIVTVHLLSAIGVVSALVIAVVNAASDAAVAVTVPQKKASLAIQAVAGLALVQGAIGTQVRGFLEDVSRAHPELARGEWITRVGVVDLVHRNLALVVVLAVVAVAILLRRWTPSSRTAIRIVDASAALGVFQLVVGGLLVNLALPKVLQVFHLLGAALMLGGLTAAAMYARRDDRSTP